MSYEEDIELLKRLTRTVEELIASEMELSKVLQDAGRLINEPEMLQEYFKELLDIE